MRVKKKCRYCSGLFIPNPRSYRSNSRGKNRRSVQISCSKSECQKQRHRDADRSWHMRNPTYDDGREKEHRQWRKEHPDYWKKYRAAHPATAKRNREQQHQRDQRRKNLANQDAIHAFYDGKIRGLIDLANQDAIRTPPTRVCEEIRRYLKWSYRLANQDVIALQSKIAHNWAHETPTTS